MKKFVALNCPACAGPLRIDIRSIDTRCDFCDAETKLHKIKGVYALHLVSRLRDEQHGLRHELRMIRVQNAVRTLDEKWKAAERDLLKGSPIRIKGPKCKESIGDAMGCGCVMLFISVSLPVTLALLTRNIPILSGTLAVAAVLILVWEIRSLMVYRMLLLKRDHMEVSYLTRRQRLMQRLSNLYRNPVQ